MWAHASQVSDEWMNWTGTKLELRKVFRSLMPFQSYDVDPSYNWLKWEKHICVYVRVYLKHNIMSSDGWNEYTERSLSLLKPSHVSYNRFNAETADPWAFASKQIIWLG